MVDTQAAAKYTGGMMKVDRTLDKLLAHEAEQARIQLETLAADLATFEQQYDMTSTEFFGDFQAGQTDDRMDFAEWASLVRMKENLLRW